MARDREDRRRDASPPVDVETLKTTLDVVWRLVQIGTVVAGVLGALGLGGL